MKKLTAEWVNKAEDDIGVARQLLAGRAQFPDQICFHCQQAIEKYLKALLQDKGIAFPRTHDLRTLVDLLVSVDKTLRRLRRGTATLSRYAVDYRYPGLRTNSRQAKAAYAKAELYRAEIRQRLGLAARNRKKP